MPQIRVKIIIDTDQLHWWAAKHHALGHHSVATALTVAAQHYDNLAPDTDGEPPAPTYPSGLDAAELEHWTDFHLDGRHAGVAHILLEAQDSTPAVGISAAARQRRQGES